MNEETPTPNDYFQPIKLESPQNQLLWLIANTEEICGDDELLKCLVEQHMITKTQYNDAIAAYWGANMPRSTTFPLSTFLVERCDFSQYYVFKANTISHEITNTLAPFDFNGHNYSTCFFKGLPLKFADVIATSNLIFTEGKIGNKNVILFKIDGIADAYFDFSHHPCGNQ